MGKRKRQMSKGKCTFCDTTFSKAAMTKHLQSCKQRKVPGTPSGSQRLQRTKILHLIVEGRYLLEYWMHLEAPATVTLADLDHFLREAWLECCGHLSAFTIEGQTYASYPSEEFDDESMDVALGDVLSPGMKFHHEYDFGTTTELALRIVSQRDGEIRGKRIQLLARNEPPSILCGSCGKLAAEVCADCIYSGKGWLCDECAGEHKCGEEMLLPVVNSPRVGMCGYTG